MKVTKVESIILKGRYHLVRVFTDEGIDGVGEVSPMNAAVNCIYPQEYNIEPHPLRDDTPIWKEPVLPKNGRMQVPERPGLGVELDEAVLNRLRD